ncbi:hypothetical protein AYO20_11703 [Fonsecaea nubica]|uniref:amidase n=1 Tax=Fonsecaea nubica TaxID=856822 RepID=A0A178BMA9_9EURO|nr:hypothetical protein AYO20_11703 [Fonsecaea nubica]OAL18769.1 hypothetical protein AYO20_11703 [Fonsecaea nubica]
MATHNYLEASAIAQERRAASIAAYYEIPAWCEERLPHNLTDFSLRPGSYYTDHEVEIIRSEANVILEKIKGKIWTALEVAKAFCKASALAQELTNCVTEVLYPEAIQSAQFLDDYLSRTGKTVGPLHGLPISLKDCFVTAPHPSSNGMAAFANELTSKDSLLVTILRDLGAIFYVKTNVPVARMMAETNNHVWGETRNPLHKKLSPGGSSGGEGALIALYASPLGVGTDIGGSVRIPSAYCNLFGLKPSFGRYPHYGARPSIPGQEFILAVNGPIARSIETLRLYSEAVLSEQARPWEYDIKSLPIPWRKDVIQPPGRRMRFGIISTHDGLVHVHPPAERALANTKAALEKQGHEIIEWSTEDHKDLIREFDDGLFNLGGAAIMDLVKAWGEPVFPCMQGYALAAEAEEILGAATIRSMVVKRNELQKAYLDRWNATVTEGKPRIDGIICATAPWTAPRLGQTQQNFYIGSTSFVNFLDFCACTFPVTFADKELDKARDLGSNFAPLTDLDGRIQADYDAEFYHGAPVALQIVARRLEEEKCLEMCEVIDAALKAS